MAQHFSDHPYFLEFCQYVDPVVAFLGRFAFLGESTHVLKFEAVEAQLAPLSATLGMQTAVVKFIIALFVAYPMGAVLRALPGKNLKHLFSLIGGFILLQFVYGPDWIHTLISSASTYLLCMLAPRKYQHIIVFVWVMGYMTFSHLFRMYVSYFSGVFDFTGTQMVITMKLTSFAYNLYDGTYDRENVFKEHADKSKARLYADRKRFAITKLPNLLEYFGYVFCFTCLLAGPAFEYTDYVSAIDGTAFVNPADKDGKKTRVPSSFLPSLRRFIVALISMVLYLKVAPIWPISSLYDPEFIRTHSHAQRILQSILAIGFEKTKYYFAWKLAEASSIWAGFGFEGFDANGKAIGWSGVENVNIIGFELATNVQSKTRHWNKRTQGWLERYTYNRANKSLVMTYFISAFWHGLYPGFFLFFLSIPILTSIERLSRSKLNPIFAPGYNGRDFETYPRTFVAGLYWLVCFILTTIAMHYVGQPFYVTTLERSMRIWGAFHHAPHIAFVVIYILLELLPSKKRKTDSEKASGKDQ